MPLKHDAQIIVRGMYNDDEVLPPERMDNGKAYQIPSPILTAKIEEADARLIPHCFRVVDEGAERIVILSTDSDVVVLMLRYIKELMVMGSREIWIRYGHGEKRRIIPMHSMYERLGTDTCRILIKAHVLTGWNETRSH